MLFSLLAKAEDQEEQGRKYEFKKSYLARPEKLLIDNTDLYCSYYIDKNDPGDMRISNAIDSQINKSEYCEDDRMYLDKGSKDGVGEGDVFLIIAKGPRIANRLTGETLGNVYEKKSLAEVIYIYENTAMVRLYKCCGGVNIGDFAIPFEEKDRLFSATIDYRRGYLTPSAVESSGRVVYAHIAKEYNRDNAATYDYITTDLGNNILSAGDLVLFYKILKKELPPLVYGLGVVINPSASNATVKVLNVSLPVDIGDWLALAPKDEVERAKARLKKTEKVPSLADPGKDSGAAPGTGPEDNPNALSVDLFFDIDERTVNASHAEAFSKIKDFIGANAGYTIVLRGYACSIGGLDYNLKISQDRVLAVRDYLIKELAVPEASIQANYYGESDPRHDNTTEEERRKNRTVNVEVTLK